MVTDLLILSVACLLEPGLRRNMKD
eukprot:COSAG02_NODE_8224_length_2652_cov_6.520538_4_plen_24_part_01